MWLDLADKATLEEGVFHFLISVRDGRPRAVRPLIAENQVLHELYTTPHPKVTEAMHHCLDAFLTEITPDPAEWGMLEAPAFLPGIAIAFNNALTRDPFQSPDNKNDEADKSEDEANEEKHEDPVGNFTAALIASLPPATDRDTALIWQSLLRKAENALEHPETIRPGLLKTLMEQNPLTALASLHVHTPEALKDLVAGNPDRPSPWPATVADLLSDARIARWLRHRWLTGPETHHACRNLGLLLEMLRRHGDHRELILAFYEGYDYFCAESRADGQGRFWPILETIENLLRTPGDSEMAIRLRQRGNAYFLKFRPLVDIILAEKGIPRDYRLLTREFVHGLLPLLNHVADGQQHISFGEVAYKEQET